MDANAEKLNFIAAHLDCYYFNSPGALALKREIQQWSCLPNREKYQPERTAPLVRRFKLMFSNNPYLEQMNLVPQAGIPADITGAAAEAFFDEAGPAVSLHTKETRPQGDGAEYLDDHVLDRYLKQQHAAAERIKLDQALEKELEFESTQLYAHQLQKKSSGKPLPTAASSIVYLLMYAAVSVGTFISIRGFIQSAGEGMERYVLLVVAVAALVAAVIKFPRYARLTAEGFCRSVFGMRWQRSKKRRTEALKKYDALQISTWYGQYRAAITADRERLTEFPETPVGQLQSTGMLKKRPHTNRADGNPAGVLQFRVPVVSFTDETVNLFLPVCCIAAGAVQSCFIFHFFLF